MDLVIILLCAALWMVPFLLKAKPGKNVLIRMLVGALVCGTIGYALDVFLIEGFDKVMSATLSGSVAVPIIRAGFVGTLEECIKFGIAFMCVRNLKNARFMDIVLIFGAVGAGFFVRESIAYSGFGVIYTIMRCVIATHILWLYIEGVGYAQEKLLNKKNMVRNFIFCIVFHAIYDLGGFIGLYQGYETFGSIMCSASFILCIVFTVIVTIQLFRSMSKKAVAC